LPLDWRIYFGDVWRGKVKSGFIPLFYDFHSKYRFNVESSRFPGILHVQRSRDWLPDLKLQLAAALWNYPRALIQAHYLDCCMPLEASKNGVNYSRQSDDKSENSNYSASVIGVFDPLPAPSKKSHIVLLLLLLVCVGLDNLGLRIDGRL